MRTDPSRPKAVRWLRWLAAACLVLLAASPAMAQVAAGYSEYYIPGQETTMRLVFNTLDAAGTDYGMHAVIAVTAWSANTTVYYDHWEDGYDFDPANPGTADQTVILANTGDQRVFESANIPTNPRGTGTFYDGGDRIYVAGGVVTVTRASWIEAVGVGNQSAAWEIYPVKPQLTTYILPFGENLGFADFNRVFVLVQATADNTTFTVDLNGDGAPDALNQNRDGDKTDPGDTATVTLQRGQTFLLDRVSACRNGGAQCFTTPGTLNSGTLVQGSSTLQVKFVAGNPGQDYCARGLSAFPRGFWTKDYYAPLDQPTGGAANTDYYLYNPQSSAITIDWEARSGTGSFAIPANSTVSFRAATAGSVPVDSGLYLKGSDVFWGVGVGDAGSNAYEWGYSLLPSTFLYTEHFLGWAPGSVPVDTAGNPGDQANDGVFLTVAQDNTRVFVDFNNDGTADLIDADLDGTPESAYVTLNRLQTQFFYDPANAAGGGDLSRAHFWATGTFTMAYGENADTAPPSTPSLDLGYIAIPGTDFVSLVLTVDKSASPEVVPTAAGSQATFTLRVNAQQYTVDGIAVADTLPPSWQYVTGTTTITLPDQTTVATDPTITGAGTAANPYVLAWSSAILGSMAENQETVITFTAQTSAVLPAGTLSQNRVQAVGTRTVGGSLQTFTATDFVYVTSGAVEIAKTSSVPSATPLYPGDRFTYTVTVTNPAGGATLTGVSLFDALPAGVTSVTGTTSLSLSSVADRFGVVSYGNSDGTRTWNSAWTEVDSGGGGAAGGYVSVTGGELRLNNDDNQAEESAARGVNLTASGATWATLAFDYRTSNNLEAADVMNVQYRLGGGGGWTALATYTNDVSGTATLNIPIASPANLTEVRFAILSTTAYTGGSEYFYVANLSITYDRSVQGGAPPDLLSSSFLYSLPTTRSLTATFDVTVDNPLASGIASITNTASTTSAQLPVQVSASVTNLVVNPGALSASVAGRVWIDGDGDGVQDIGEPGIANVEVTLKDRFGTPVAVTHADVNGRFLFTGITAGTGYYVGATAGLPAGLAQDFPAGHSDNQTNPFTLANGQDYTGADLGYRPATGTLTFGDLIWVDPDASGQRDLGEVGLGGVTVQLYRDDGNGGLDLADTLLGTTTSAPDGSYLFTNVPNVPASSTYFVAATVPANYTPTTGLNWRLTSVVGGVAYLTADFGFQASGGTSTYTITDRVWYDANGDGLVSGEQGIAGITMEILDGSLNVIGTAVTDGNGLFAFTGLAGNGADYTTRISDTSGFLQNYYGTTSYAIAKLRAESNLAGDVDRSLAPSYGFLASRSIGDTVFSDVSGNGLQEGGEPGVAGVVVALYRDGNGNGRIDAAAVDCPPAASCLVGSVATDANGQYQFPGLTNGNYIVSVGSPPSGYAYTGVGVNADSDPVVAGQQQSRTMIGPGNITNADFPYRPTVPRAISGVVWNDADADGTIGGIESRLAGVTVDILLGTTVVATVTTNATGAYSASGLASLAGYTVRITDANGALTGYTSTYEPTEGTTSPFNYQESVDLSDSDAANLNFGFRRPPVTYAAIAYLTAYPAVGPGVTVEWRTSLEVGTAGFDLLRLDPSTGLFVKLTERLLPGLIVHPQGGVYRFQDVGAPTEGVLTYKLLEQDVRGRRREYGPYSVSASGGAAPRAFGRSPEDLQRRGFSRQAGGPSRAGLALRSAADAERRQVARGRNARRGQAVKVTTREVGLHYLSAADLAPRLGVPLRRVANLFGAGRITLSNRGRVVPYLPDERNTGLYFYAEPVGSQFTDDNAYWITSGTGQTMSVAASAPGGLLSTTFTETVHAEQDQYSLLTSFNDPQQDFWAWDWLFAGYDGMDVRSFKIRAAGVAGFGDTSLTLHLVGGSDGAPNSNHVQILFNGFAVGEARWNGLATFDIEFPLGAGSVLEGDNVVELKAVVDAGVPYNLVYVDSFDLTYQRRYRAVDDVLPFSAANGSQVAIGGFSAPGVLLLDVTDPARPALVTGATVALASDGQYELQFGAAGASDALRYLAVLPTRAKPASELVAWRDSGLRRDGSAAEYLLVAPESLKEAARSLSEYRNNRGISTMVVGLDEIYDEFNAGIAEPAAIRTFLRHATSRWSTPPRYVTLVGRGTWDYRNVQGFGDNLVPTLLVGSPDGLVASDVAFADLEGDDGIPEIALGRLPVLTSQELLDYVAKIQEHEGTGAAEWQHRLLMASDNPDAAGNFTADSESVAALVPPSYSVSRVSLATTSGEAGRQAILQAMGEGVGVFNYIGHGSLDRLADENLFTSADVASLNNADRMPVFLAMTCSVGNFAIPGYPSLGEAMLLRKGGGAFAVWAPSGLSENTHAVRLDQGFFRGAFVDNEKVVGDLVVRGLRDLDAPGSEYMRYMYNLLGEPVSRLPD